MTTPYDRLRPVSTYGVFMNGIRITDADKWHDGTYAAMRPRYDDDDERGVIRGNNFEEVEQQAIAIAEASIARVRAKQAAQAALDDYGDVKPTQQQSSHVGNRQ